MIKDELDHYYILLLEQEKHKYSTLLEKTNKLERVEQKWKEAESENTKLERNFNEQRETMHNLQTLFEKSRENNARLEEELNDKSSQLEFKEKQFKHVVGELKSELEELGIFTLNLWIK